ncbi:DUF7269 family protein [Halosimplex sp. J119]
MHRPVRTAFGVVGVLATLLGVVAVVSPSIVTGTEPLATLAVVLGGIDPRTLFVFGSAAVGLYVAVSSWRSSGARLVGDDRDGVARFERALAEPPETVTASDRTLAGNDFDAAVERAVAGDGRAMDGVRDRLRGLAAARLDRAGCSDESIASGEWTDDRTAGAFLSEDAGPVHSLRSRLRFWLDPETERDRRVRRTVAAIESISESTSNGTDRDAGTAGAASDDSGPQIRGGGVGE